MQICCLLTHSLDMIITYVQSGISLVNKPCNHLVDTISSKSQHRLLNRLALFVLTVWTVVC